MPKLTKKYRAALVAGQSQARSNILTTLAGNERNESVTWPGHRTVTGRPRH